MKPAARQSRETSAGTSSASAINNRVFALALITIFAAVSGSASAAGGATPAERPTVSAHQGALDVLNARIAAKVSGGNPGSISAVAFKCGDIIWSNAVGAIDEGSKTTADESSIYRAGSITKTMTAILLMLMVERNVVALDEPVEKYLPEIRQLRDYAKYRPITFEQLASHTAGLAREPNLSNADEGPIELWERKVIESIPRTAIKYEPGTRYHYSNIGFGILGLAISRAAGKPFMPLMTEELFEPAGMADSSFVVSEENAIRLARGYQINKKDRAEGARAAAEHRGRGYKVPNGGVYTTPADLARLARVILQRSALLSEPSASDMTTAHTPASTENEVGHQYGLGLKLFKSERGDIVIGHGGAVPGYHAALYFSRSYGWGLALMSSYDAGPNDLQPLALDTLRQLIALEASSAASDLHAPCERERAAPSAASDR